VEVESVYDPAGKVSKVRTLFTHVMLQVGDGHLLRMLHSRAAQLTASRTSQIFRNMVSDRVLQLVLLTLFLQAETIQMHRFALQDARLGSVQILLPILVRRMETGFPLQEFLYSVRVFSAKVRW
jgi:hypothetical protein